MATPRPAFDPQSFNPSVFTAPSRVDISAPATPVLAEPSEAAAAAEPVASESPTAPFAASTPPTPPAQPVQPVAVTPSAPIVAAMPSFEEIGEAASVAAAQVTPQQNVPAFDDVVHGTVQADADEASAFTLPIAPTMPPMAIPVPEVTVAAPMPLVAPAPVERTPVPERPEGFSFARFGDLDEDLAAPVDPREEFLEEVSAAPVDPVVSLGHDIPTEALVAPTLVAPQVVVTAAPAEEWIPEWSSTSPNKGESFFISASHGGAGKTTFAYLFARTIQTAYLRAAVDREVYLVETDYVNPKLHDRFQMDRGQDSGHFAAFLEQSRLVRDRISAATLAERERKALENSTYVDPQSGIRVIAAPYELTDRNAESTRFAIEKIVSLLLARGAFVVMDAHTLGGAEDSLLDRNLAPRADRVVVLTDAPSPNPETGKYEGGHIHDALRIVKSLRTPAAAKGFGIPTDRISLVLNRTSEEDAMAAAQRGDVGSVHVAGVLPIVPSITKGFVREMGAGPEAVGLIRAAAQVVNEVAPRPELEPLLQPAEAPAPTPTKRKGFFGLRRA
ncbi:hypothetical protein [Frondihabitans sucicola]|nr:hypothetical protein [Frondihabitans sucicola]